jgi:hypothetical protein
MALDSKDIPHIVYVVTNSDSKSESQLKHVYFDNNNWTTENITSDINRFSDYTMDIDSNDNICIVLRDGKTLNFIRKIGHSWNINELDTLDENSYIEVLSMAIDSNNNPHICYRESTSYKLKYITFSNNKWTEETIVDMGWKAYDCSITVDDDNTPHISFFDWPSKNVIYAKRK